MRHSTNLTWEEKFFLWRQKRRIVSRKSIPRQLRYDKQIFNYEKNTSTWKINRIILCVNNESSRIRLRLQITPGTLSSFFSSSKRFLHGAKCRSRTTDRNIFRSDFAESLHQSFSKYVRLRAGTFSKRKDNRLTVIRSLNIPECCSTLRWRHSVLSDLLKI